MRVLRFLICAVLLAVLLPVETVSASMLPDELSEALPAEAGQLLDELDSGGYDHSTLMMGLVALCRAICNDFFTLLRDHVNSAVLLLGVVLLCAFVDSMHQAADNGTERYVTLAGALVITVIAASNIQGMTGVGLDALEQMEVFSRALLPTLAAAVAAAGGVVSAGVRQVLTAVFADSLISLIRRMLLPLVYCYTAVSAANAVLPEHELKRLRDGIGKMVTGALTGLLVLFTAFLTIAGAVGTAADAASLRLAKSTISTVVPVVGSIISDAADSVLASAALLKSSVGVFGTLGILAICLTPFLQLGVQYLLYKLTALIASVVGSEPLVELVNSLGTALGLLLAMTGSCAVLLLISVASSLSVVTT